LLGERGVVLNVPFYQRRFDWQREQVEQLWDDLKDAETEN